MQLAGELTSHSLLVAIKMEKYSFGILRIIYVPREVLLWNLAREMIYLKLIIKIKRQDLEIMPEIREKAKVSHQEKMKGTTRIKNNQEYHQETLETIEVRINKIQKWWIQMEIVMINQWILMMMDNQKRKSKLYTEFKRIFQVISMTLPQLKKTNKSFLTLFINLKLIIWV